ncbi:dephospho-CoA kinase/protein folding accessory domain-containing protein [Bremerella volcania]|uniref:Dephospho-CoA kinase/protein folding accessory domain-containing protein n=1 Tax=Bremerella volcania TaxID=2527984 RepID=A0A518C3T5_9BACT|nr:GrpB family protein [Bremerella volcania]QDU73887.1 dephospho-CoA kinase/protein folding accessory domain-containing protein [Bremerella volcania]
MPPPIQVELVPHDPAWAEIAAEYSHKLTEALGTLLIAVYHIGSTAIPGICAKPVIDLMPVVGSLELLDRSRSKVEALGYEWWGELGLPGRRYCSKDDSVTSARLAQLHCYEEGSPEIIRHLAFRDYLSKHSDLARQYEQLKRECQVRHRGDSHAYSDCKSKWIQRIEAEAVDHFSSATR